MKCKGHKQFGDLLGTLSFRPFTPQDGASLSYVLDPSPQHDVELMEMDLTYVRPSKVVTMSGSLSRAQNLRVAVDVGACVLFAATFENPLDLYQDTNHNQIASLEDVIGKLPMFVNELGLIAQVVADYYNILEISPIVHCELAGRGIEYCNGRATWDFRNKCEGKLKDLESLCRGAYSARNIPQALMVKYERRVRDYMRSYRMGVDSHDLEKLRAVIKSHRNMLDSYESFIKSEATDDATDRHVLDRSSIMIAIDKAMGKNKKAPVHAKAAEDIMDFCM